MDLDAIDLVRARLPGRERETHCFTKPKVVAAHLKSKQLLPFVSARQGTLYPANMFTYSL